MPIDPPSLGGETETELGRCFHLSLAVADHLEDAAARAERLHAAAARLKIAPEALLFVDVETAGLTAAPLFLIGTLSLSPAGLMLTQYFARGYEEEAALLAAFSRSLAPCRMVVTFNGETFDLPYLRDRALYHRHPPPLFPDHLDLLPADFTYRNMDLLLGAAGADKKSTRKLAQLLRPLAAEYDHVFLTARRASRWSRRTSCTPPTCCWSR